MSRFFIEVPHQEEKEECLRVIQIFLSTGSHYLTNAEWGCEDGDHKAWLMVEVESKKEALQIIPPAFRSQAKIVKLGKFSIEAIEKMIQEHQ